MGQGRPCPDPVVLGQVVAEQERFEQFEGLAREMGARHWERVIRLVDRAVKKRKRPLACQVFEAALTSGPHLDFLKEKYEQLQGGMEPGPQGVVSCPRAPQTQPASPCS